MYHFIDVSDLPNNTRKGPESFSINGEYPEDLVEGYLTLNVTGRELLESKLSTQDIDGIDGTQYREKWFEARELVVTYQLAAPSDREFRERFNALAKALDAQEARLIFDDEPDKYFTGTPYVAEDIPEGRNSIIAQYTIYCADPHKWSSVEKNFIASKNALGIMEAAIVNEGSIPVPVNYKIRHIGHDNGYIGIVSNAGIMQFGDVTEIDGEIRDRSEMLLSFSEASDFAQMTDNNAVLSQGTILQNGSWKTGTVNGIRILMLDNKGTGSYWHGAGKRMAIPADSTGERPKDWYLKTRTWFETSRVGQTGLIQITITDESNSIIAFVQIHKGTTTNNIAHFNAMATGAEVKTEEFEPRHGSKQSDKYGYIEMQKSGELFRFNLLGTNWYYRVPALTNKKAAAVNIYVGQFGVRPDNMFVTHCYFRELYFRADHVPYMFDLPNRYRKGGSVEISGEESKIYVDTIPALSDEVLGTQYFKAAPGENKVEFYYSDFCEPAPEITATIREGWI